MLFLLQTHTWKLPSSDLVLMSTCIINVCSQGLQDWPSRCLHQSRRRVHRIINKRLGHRHIGCLRIRCTASRPRCPGLATRSTRIPVNFRWAKQYILILTRTVHFFVCYGNTDIMRGNFSHAVWGKLLCNIIAYNMIGERLGHENVDVTKIYHYWYASVTFRKKLRVRRIGFNVFILFKWQNSA